MLDKITLKVDGYKIENFISYSIESDLFCADDFFDLQFSNAEIPIQVGKKCEIYVNDQLELTGIIEKVKRSTKKDSGTTLSISGRDYMGLLVEHHIEKFPALKNYTLKDLTALLLKAVPFINQKNVIYQGNAATTSAQVGMEGGGKAAQDPFATEKAPHKFIHMEPGDTIFDVLKSFVTSRGLLFYCQADGTFVFGKPREKAKALFNIAFKRDGSGSNIEEAEVEDDITDSFSKITIIGQQQGSSQDPFADTKEKINTKATLDDEDFPYFKPFVKKNNNDEKSPKAQASHTRDRMRAKRECLKYTLPGHSQGGKNWRINEFCQVEDEINGKKGLYLIYSRRFSLDKKDGSRTEVKLGRPGVAL